MSANLENSAMATGLKKVSFHPNPKEGQCQECSNYHMIILVLNASKFILQILQTVHVLRMSRCSRWVSRGSRTRDQVSNIHWIMELAREYQKNIYLCFIDYAKAFNRVDRKNLWKILKKIGVPDCVTCLLRNLYVGQEAAVRTGRGTTDLFKLGKVV